MSLTAWRKSSFSEDSQSDCVEVAFAPAAVAVRDSKNTTGPTLNFDPHTWRSLTANLSGAPVR
jgi:Domain of unknown function (DUF397)